jgi:hypothetical protein
VTFEVPVSYDAVTNIGMLDLGGTNKEGEFVECGLAEFDRATNGNCLLVWNITYDPPGKHNIRARLLCEGPQMHWNTTEVIGPITPFYSSNVCQFFEATSIFDSNSAILYAKLPDKMASYSIELKTPAGRHIKTITGCTSNGVIDVEWNLTNEHGVKYKDGSFDRVFHVTLLNYNSSYAPSKIRINKLGG